MATKLNKVAAKVVANYIDTLTIDDVKPNWGGCGLVTAQNLIGFANTETDPICASVWRDNLDFWGGKAGPYCPECIFGDWLACTGKGTIVGTRVRYADTPEKFLKHLKKWAAKLRTLMEAP